MADNSLQLHKYWAKLKSMEVDQDIQKGEKDFAYGAYSFSSEEFFLNQLKWVLEQ